MQVFDSLEPALNTSKTSVELVEEKDVDEADQSFEMTCEDETTETNADNVYTGKVKINADQLLLSLSGPKYFVFWGPSIFATMS